MADEVRDALHDGRPVVALESSVLAQGMPAPHNLEVARACELAVRAEGAVPAITAVVDGRLACGIAEGELLRLADRTSGALKVSERDLSTALARGALGGTTVSATCAIASAAGISLFATGGIGGVHREAEQTFDVSQDLPALSRHPVAVVSSGAKAILDLPRTLEMLETLGVPVIGYQVGELPAFYCGSSGIPLEHRADDPTEAARILLARFDWLGQGGVLIANRVPLDAGMDPSALAPAIVSALAAAGDQGVTGKGLTPFLLAEVARRTGGESIRANRALLVDNARVAARIAVSLAQLRSAGAEGMPRESSGC
jgi:pseudouridine-5'-phosphate glycosidase